jgi:hypothetical protein
MVGVAVGHVTGLGLNPLGCMFISPGFILEKNLLTGEIKV